MIKGEVVTALMSKIMRVILTGVSMIAIIMEACSPGQSTDAIPEVCIENRGKSDDGSTASGGISY